ncbi:Hypothetical protein, putative [Bodo saltans]|uniref:Clu domain-containing protein n=1 Tax=Bodo saltans TaxID=75058 RepID=A0A0S4ILI9_BODSA|nr:Hypothetical protein, putative [Bodo saltans]|eukprot:CUE71482.1 Hypothetical protein, putative [Bodo saltans]
MSHVRRYRLASASRGAQKRNVATLVPAITDISHSTPLRTATTSAMPSARDEGHLSTSSRAIYSTISPLVPSFAPITAAHVDGLQPPLHIRLVSHDVSASEVTVDVAPVTPAKTPEPAPTSFWITAAAESFSLKSTVVEQDAREGDDGAHCRHLDELPQRTLAGLLQEGRSQRDLEVLDVPARPWELRLQQRRVLPLTATNVQLLRPEPSDPRTGESLLRGSHRVDMVHKWFPHVELSTIALRDAMVNLDTVNGSDDAGNASTTTGSYGKQHYHGGNSSTASVAGKRQRHGPRIQMVRDSSSPHRQQKNGAPSHNRGSPGNTSVTSMFHLSEIVAHDVSNDVEWNNQSMGQSPRHRGSLAHIHQAPVQQLQRPFDHLHAADTLTPLLQVAHFQPSQYPQKSWIRLALSTEATMIQSAQGLAMPTESDGGSYLPVDDMSAAGGAVRLRSTTTQLEGTTTQAAVTGTAASIMSDIVTDPSFLFQRMLSLSIPDSELVTVRAELLIRQISNPSSSVASPLSNTSSAASPVRSTPEAGASSLSSGSRNQHRRFSELAHMVKATITEVEDPLMAEFSDVIKAAMRQSGSKPRTECRLQLKVGTSPSMLIQFPKANSSSTGAPMSLFSAGSPRKHQPPSHIVDSATAELMTVPAEFIEKIPSNVSSVFKHGGVNTKPAPPSTLWNAVFQYWMGILGNPISASQAILAHQQLVKLQRAFIERCGMFVESNLLTTILHDVQVTVGGILFSLMPHTDDDFSHHKDLRMDLGTESSKLFTSIDPGDSPKIVDDEYQEHVENDEGADEVESNQKMASSHIRNLGAVYEHWYKPNFPDEVTTAPGGNSADDGVALLAVNAAITSSSEVIRAYSKGKAKSSASGAGSFAQKKMGAATNFNEDSQPSLSVGFPLACVVRYLGFVVSCTARLPSSVESSSQPALRHTDINPSLASTLAKELGVATYVERSGSGMNMKVKRVDGSRHLVYGRCAPADATPLSPLCYITSLPSFMPPLIPTMRYRRHLRLRPEFTAHLADTVPGDLFSSSASITSFPEKTTAQGAAVKIARRLLHKSVADLVSCWEKRCSDEPLHGDAMCAAMHRRGINISLLGYIGDMVHQKVKSLRSLKENSSQPQEEGVVTSRPTSAASGGGGGETDDGEVLGHKLDALEKTLRTVKEELAVRAFRAHCNVKLRDVCLSVKGDVKLVALQFRMTQLVKQLLGNESDPLVSTFWSTVITPYVRDTFHFRAPLGRKDLSLRTTLRRLESLCGMVLSPGTAKDALNAVMLHKHEDLLTLELRNTRAIAIGSVLELRPYVKAPPPPFLPPLWALPEADIIGRNGGPVVQYLAEEEKRANQQFGELSNYSNNLRIRKIEVMLAQGEQNSEACETMLVQSIVNAQTQVVPLYHRATRYCLMLSRLYLSVHRNLDAARCAEDAVSVALAIPQSQHQTVIASLFAVLYASSKESGSREQVIHALERNIAACVKRLTQLARDPYKIALVWSSNHATTSAPPTHASSQEHSASSPTHLSTFLPINEGTRSRSHSPDKALKGSGDSSPHASSPSPATIATSVTEPHLCPVRRQIIFEQSLLVNSTQALMEAYKAMSYNTLDIPLPFHESIVSPQFAQFLYELAALKAPRMVSESTSPSPTFPSHPLTDKGPAPLASVDISAAKCLLTRVLNLVEILQLKATSTSDGSDSARARESQAVVRCRDNIDAFRDL